MRTSSDRSCELSGRAPCPSVAPAPGDPWQCRGSNVPFVAFLVKDVDREAADLFALLVGDQNRVVVILRFRLFAQHAARDQVGRIHRLDIIGQIGITCVEVGLGIHKVKMIERHHTLPCTAPAAIKRRGTLVETASANPGVANDGSMWPTRQETKRSKFWSQSSRDLITLLVESVRPFAASASVGTSAGRSC